MLRALCLLLCLCCATFAQTLNRSVSPASSPSSPVEVFYAFGSSTLTTYNIDPQTLVATAVGTTSISATSGPYLVPSPNGQFLYYVTYFAHSSENRLYVYDTNAMGVPGSTPVQTIDAEHLTGLVANPAGTFLYSVLVGSPTQQLTTPYAIVRSVIDPAAGKLSNSVAEATYQLDSNASGNDCYLSVLGFNFSGSVMYDGIFCSGPHGSGSTTYNQRSVDLQAGTLGPDEEIYYYSYYASSEYVDLQMENNRLFAFVSYFNQGPNADAVDVFPVANITTPGVTCTASMLAICGDFTFALAHPSGEYVFLGDSDLLTDIGEVNLGTRQIVQVSSLPYGARLFSPDGEIVYGENAEDSSQVYISGFNAANGEVTPGSTIQLPYVADYLAAVERY